MAQYIQSGEYDATELDGEWIILNTDNYTVTKINEVGGECWALLKEVQTVDSLTQEIGEKFSSAIPISQMKKDIETFLSQLSECGLIKNVD
ncbi:PqqD family protein [Neobacillus terrae]|uniref:PqqD family protein n=1 Tax=Neobacillus terrae TaxID=3034837 RepID=UPI00140B3FD8|nr:PqqD family protein [Neobacillus terrae]NHM29291.1 PqqD family protein [Neobacillus terrae]